MRLEARALEGVADDCEARGPGGVQAVEGQEREQDVVVRVQGALLKVDAALGRRGPDVEVVVLCGEVGVAAGLGELCLLPGWGAWSLVS